MYQKINRFITVIFGMTLLACSNSAEPNPTYIKACDLCGQHDFNELSYAIQNYLHNDEELIETTPQFMAQIDSLKTVFKSGYKMIECGCTDDYLTYRLWCAGDETLELYLELDDGKFILSNIAEVSFPHP